MRVYRSAAEIIIFAPAKLNLFFEVLGKRTDDYHEIETLMAPIDLFDRLSFEPLPGGGVQFDCRWSSRCGSLGELPPPHENLALRALQLLAARAEVSPSARVRLIKRIPAAAGLGGGSSDAAAALVAGNVGWQLGLPHAALAELAEQLGSDVPFFLGRSAAICRGRGERVEPVAGVAGVHFVVARPPAELSTAQVYAHSTPGTDDGSAAALVAALRAGDCRAVRRCSRNRLESAARKLSPWIERLGREFASCDPLAAQLTGSGSSYFGMFRGARQARRAAARLRSRNVGQVYAVRSC